MSLATLEAEVRNTLAQASRHIPPRGPLEPPGEGRVVLSGVSWDQYMAIDEERGADHSHPRLYYLDEQLEIMTTSRRHEKLSEWLSDLLSDYLLDLDMEVFPCGQAALQKVNQAGAEPDKSWCLGEEKEFLDIALEIALTSGGLNKLEIYRRFPVQEVWFWRKDGLEIWDLKADASGYDGPSRVSRCCRGSISRCSSAASPCRPGGRRDAP